jgi:hypothetical protein
MTQYQSNGFKTRRAYLTFLAAKYQMPESTVIDWAKRLGDEEDFTGLVDAIEDYVEDEYNKVF